MSSSFFRTGATAVASSAIAFGLVAAGLSVPAYALIETDNDLSVVGYGEQSASYIANLGAAVDGHAVLDVATGNATSYILRDDNTVTATRYDGAAVLSSLVNQFDGRDVVDLEAEYSGAFALLDDGALVAESPSSSFGANNGFTAATADQEFSAISSGRHFAIALRTDGTLRSWGENGVGGDLTEDVALIAAGFTHAIVYTTDGHILGFGDNASGQINTVAAEAAIDGEEVTALAAGAGTSFALLADGSVAAWGYGAAQYNSEVATALGSHAAVAIEAYATELYVTTDEGRVFVIETNPNVTQDYNAGVNALIDNHRVAQVTAGPFHTLVVLEDPSVQFGLGEANLDSITLTTADSVDLEADGFRGGAEYTITWDAAVASTGTIATSGVVSQSVAIPDTLSVGTHTVSLTADGETFTQSVRIGKGFTAVVPTISGTKTVGAELTAVTGPWSSGTTFAYSWLRDGKKIANATASTYQLAPADAGKTIQVSVKGTKAGFSAVTKTSAKTTKIAKANLVAGTVDVTGDRTVGQTLTATPVNWGPVTPSFSYQWYANGKAISKATKSALAIPATLTDAVLSLRVTGSATGYNPAVAWWTPSGFVERAYIDLDDYYVDGVTAVGKTLSVKRTMEEPQTTGLTLRYQWLRNGEPIGGATASTYKPTSADAGFYVSARVYAARGGYYPTYINSYSTRVYALPVKAGTVSVSGTAKVGKMLTATVSDGGPGVDYDAYWVRTKGSVIEYPEIEGNTYTLQASDKGWKYQVEAFYHQTGFASVSVISKATKAVVQ